MPEVYINYTTDVQGKVIKEKQSDASAAEVYPPPSDLDEDEQNIWNTALHDIPARFFRKRNLHLLRKYCAARARVDRMDFDPTDRDFRVALGFVTRLEGSLGLSVAAELARQRYISRADEMRELRAARVAAHRAKQNGGASQGEPPPPANHGRNQFSYVPGSRAA